MLPMSMPWWLSVNQFFSLFAPHRMYFLVKSLLFFLILEMFLVEEFLLQLHVLVLLELVSTIEQIFLLCM